MACVDIRHRGSKAAVVPPTIFRAARLLNSQRCGDVIVASASMTVSSQRKGHHLFGARSRSATLCLVNVLLNASGPILLDWVRQAHGGTFRFSVPALTFHAWAVAATLGLGCTFWNLGPQEGWRRLARADMLWRFCLTTALFCAGDIVGFMSMQRLDVGTFSLLGKSLAIVCTLVFSRVLLDRRHTRSQYFLVVIVVAATVVFCQEEQRARESHTMPRQPDEGRQEQLSGLTGWSLGLVQRTAAVGLASLGAVLQEKLFRRDHSVAFMEQLCWMGCGAMLMSLITLRCLYGLSVEHLLQGFDDWRVLLLLTTYVATGLTTGLVVKQLGAVTKALCVPVYLGGCYAYAVYSGGAALTPQTVAAWFISTSCVLLFAVFAQRPPSPKDLEKDGADAK